MSCALTSLRPLTIPPLGTSGCPQFGAVKTALLGTSTYIWVDQPSLSGLNAQERTGWSLPLEGTASGVPEQRPRTRPRLWWQSVPTSLAPDCLDSFSHFCGCAGGACECPSLMTADCASFHGSFDRCGVCLLLSCCFLDLGSPSCPLHTNPFSHPCCADTSLVHGLFSTLYISKTNLF